MTLPDDRVYDGVDLVPFILGETSGEPHPYLYFRADHIKAMRKGQLEVCS